MFQKQIEQKFINRIPQELIEEKYKLFKESFQNPEKIAHIQDSKEEQYQEGFLRDVFRKVLGYTINPEPDYNLITEKKNDSDSRKADGAIILNGNVKAVIELKGCDTTDLSKIENQAFGYKAHNPGCRYVIISNFEKLRLYIDDASDFLEFRLFSLGKDDFRLFYTCLALNQIENDIPSLMKSESLSEENSITTRFYADYSRFKKELFKDICDLNIGDEELGVRSEELDDRSEELGVSYDEELRRSDSLAESTEFARRNKQDDIVTSQHSLLNSRSSILNSRLTLFKKTQKLLDRILFILFCEDRGLLPENSVLTIINQWKKLKELDAYQPLYNRFKNYFGHINTGYKSESDPSYVIFAYNGGLFKTDEILDKIKISDDVLLRNATILSNYDFESQVSVDILGHIFEHSLSELDDIRNEDGSLLNPKSSLLNNNISKRKKDGVFYTPSYITKYIVQNTVGELCKAKKQELGINDEDFAKRNNKNQKAILAKKLEDYRNYLLSLKILDPACGSGAFLNAALQFLKDEHSYIDELNAKLYGDTIVFPGIENAILENNIFGVDINDESVEIAKLSLWLHTAQKGRKLTTLTNNIKCGNSLIDDPNVAGDKAFNWEKEFPSVFGVRNEELDARSEDLDDRNEKSLLLNSRSSILNHKTGFDVVIGNPPYVTMVNILNAEERKYYQTHYKTVKNKSDLYSIFTERAQQLLKENGKFGFIFSNSWLGTESFSAFREFLAKDVTVTKLTELPDKVFADASVRTIICLFTNKKPSENDSIDVEKYDNGKFVSKGFTLSYNKIWQTPNYNFNLERNIELTKIETVPLGQIALFSLGIKTSDDKRFVFNEKKDDDCYLFLRGRNIKRWCKPENDEYLWYKPELICEKPGGRPRVFGNFRVPQKIVIQDIAQEITATLDTEKYLCNDTLNIIFDIDENYDIKCILALLNSKLINFWFKKLYPEGLHIKINQLQTIPIPSSSLLNSNSSILTSLSDKMLSLHEELQSKSEKFLHRINETYGAKKSALLEEFYNHTFAEIDKEFSKQKIRLSLKQKDELEEYFNSYKTELSSINEQISATDKQIDSEVYKLYGLTDDEIAIVENSSK